MSTTPLSSCCSKVGEGPPIPSLVDIVHSVGHKVGSRPEARSEWEDRAQDKAAGSGEDGAAEESDCHAESVLAGCFARVDQRLNSGCSPSHTHEPHVP